MKQLAFNRDKAFLKKNCVVCSIQT